MSYFRYSSKRNIQSELLEEQGLDTYLSVRADQEVDNQKTIKDVFVGFWGLLVPFVRHFMNNPNQAYLVVGNRFAFCHEKNSRCICFPKENPKKIGHSDQRQGQAVYGAFGDYLGTKSVSDFITILGAGVFLSSKNF